MFLTLVMLTVKGIIKLGIFEPRRKKSGFLHLQKQRRRSASR